MSDRIVTIRVFNYPTEAYLARSYLEANGIWAFVLDNQAIIVGGSRLQVRESDAPLAARLLEELDEMPYEPYETYEPGEEEYEDDEEY